MSTPRLTIIGLDAVTPTVVEAMLDAGELPNLARIFSAGSRGVLRSTLHPLTPQAWTTMVTGVNAGRHGVWDFTERDESGYHLRIVNGGRRRAPALWDFLDTRGVRSGILNIPFTAPAPALSGFAVAGLDAAPRDEAMTYPRELADELRARFGAFDLDHSFPLGDGGSVDLDLVKRACAQKVELATWLRERFDPDLLFVVFMSADHIHHLCWPEWDEKGLESRVAAVYRILDEAAGALAGPLDHDVLVVSDHGGGRLDGVVNLNAWLAREGFLSYAGAQTLVGSGEAARRVVNRLDRLGRRLPKRIRSYARRRHPGVRDRVHTLRSYSVIDWQQTRAFAYGTFGNIVVNLRGRERSGIVGEDEYDAVRDDIAQRAASLEDPSGRPIVSAVYRREELFHGPELDGLPDLIVEFDDYRWLGKGNLRSRGESIWDKIEIAPGSNEAYVGSHRREGIVALAGPTAARGRTLSASIEDVAPTALYLLGVPVPDDLEGRVLEEAVRPELLDERPPSYEAYTVKLALNGSSSRAGANEVEKRLRDLGYLE
jgi:predicted AlkP superfamily phosphohydrolase/phosphomutase